MPAGHSSCLADLSNHKSNVLAKLRAQNKVESCPNRFCIFAGVASVAMIAHRVQWPVADGLLTVGHQSATPPVARRERRKLQIQLLS